MVNQVVLIGRITRDLEMRSTSTGKEVMNFTIAVNRNYKNQSGEYDADFIGCIAFNQSARFMSSYMQKGQLISVTGRIQTRNYDNNSGQRVYVTEVIADSVNSLERRENTQNNYQSNYNKVEPQQNYNSQPTMSPQDFMQSDAVKQPAYAIDQIDDDELPF